MRSVPGSHRRHPEGESYPTRDAPLVASSVVLELSTPGILRPAFDLVDRVVQRRLDLRRLLRETSDDHEQDENSERDQAEKDKGRSYTSMKPMPVHLGHERTGDRRENRSEDDRNRDRRGDREQPREAPTRRRATPTMNHAASPRSRSHIGAEKTRESEVTSIWTTAGASAVPTTFGAGSDFLKRSKKRKFTASALSRSDCERRSTDESSRDFTRVTAASSRMAAEILTRVRSDGKGTTWRSSIRES